MIPESLDRVPKDNSSVWCWLPGMEQLFDRLLRVLDARAILAIVLPCFELLQETEARRLGRVPRSAVLGHAETLLTAMSHLIPTKAVRLISCARAGTAGQASCGSPKALLDGKDSPDRQGARGRGRSVCENRMLHCGGPKCARHRQPAHHFSSADSAAIRASRPGAAPQQGSMPPAPAWHAAAMDRSVCWSHEIADAERGVRQRDV
ncbi:hypothetical protein ACVIHI_001915 [Bradyrhizobium sp. USDA 4524]|nr:hypothetical protein [Bradyrhizobium sp. USDA 4538]MCP1905729.1 hypothetical protein [Bradyrhizobium sp. USDA 4537]MCP1988615.1 hypothetical protein [Bradyrhizobium sp. USDA 4539]